MSTNTTSTSDAPDAVRSVVEAGNAGARDPGVGSAMNALLDPAVVAKLANEFFTALPGSEAIPEPAAYAFGIPAEVPNPTITAPAVPGAQAASVLPGAPASVQATSPAPLRALTEHDFQTIAVSLADMLKLVPSTLPASPVSGVASPDPLGADSRGPWAVPPNLPSAPGMYAFPGVPETPAPVALPQTASLDVPLSGLPPTNATNGVTPPAVALPGSAGMPDKPLDPALQNPWTSAPQIPSAQDAFSFPRVPGHAPPVPMAPLHPPETLPSAEIVEGKTQAAIPTKVDRIPSLPAGSPPSSVPVQLDLAQENSQKSPFSVPAAFPSVSDLFSMPGVPGAQSVPGAPPLPASVPNDASWPRLADVDAAPTSGTSPDASTVNRPGMNSTAVQAQTFEFRPDVIPQLETTKRPLDPNLIRADFPILQESVNGRPLVWLDNAATTQKPNAVIDRLSYFYRHENSNIHRAAHTLAARATDAYESAREKTRRFLNASTTREIIFVRGTTEGINLVAQSWGRRNVQKDDEVVITWLEHHANIVPWQQLCAEKGARLRVAPVNDRGEVILEEYEKLLSPRTRIVSFSQVSNALGTVTPAREMVEMAHRHGACVLVDGAQAVSHMRVNVQELDCDFYVFSGHKVFGPTGIGVVYGKLGVLENMPPWQGGGNMIVDVTFEKTVYQPAPARFEAGTGNIADAVGLGAALDYVEEVGMESIAAYEHELLEYGTAGLLTVPGMRLIGTARDKAGVLSFVLDDVRTEDVGVALNHDGIAVRAGHHCAQPILRRMGVESTVRPSLAFYNTREDLDRLVAALFRLQAGRG